MVILSLQWLDFWRCAAALNRRNLEEMRRLRTRMFYDVSFCVESYMRSPGFLELMRYNMAVMGHPKGRSLDGEPAASMAMIGHPKGQSASEEPSASVASS
jgi:hypothetical protein